MALQDQIDEQIETQKEQQQLTIKQARFLQIYLETGNATEAAMQAYDVKDRKSAKSIGAENLSKLDLTTILEANGLTDSYISRLLRRAAKAKKVISAAVYASGKDGKPVNDFIEVPDWGSRLKALELALKLKNKFPAEKVKVEHTVAQQLIDELKKELGIDEQSLSGIREVGMDGVRDSSVRLPEEGSEADSTSLPSGQEEGDSTRDTSGDQSTGG